MTRTQLPIAFLAFISCLGAQQLHVGDVLPKFTGQTMTGKSMELPASSGPAVAVFSFSRAAGEDSRLWNDRLAKEFPDGVARNTVIMLESVPRLFRGVAVSSIKRSMPVSMQDRTVISYEDELIWKRRLDVSDGNRASVVLLGPDGHIRWISAGSFADLEYSRLREEIRRIVGQNSPRK